MTSRVTVYEVGPRDGLQNEAVTVPTADKLALVGALAAAGLRRIEATSFVSPRWIPQLADAAEVTAALPALPGVSYVVLVPNAKGLERLAASLARAGDAPPVDAAVFLSASETHSRKNINRSIEGAFRELEALIPTALARGLRVRGYVSTVWGCPYEGRVDPVRAAAVVERLLALGCYQVSLGDTIGVATPNQTRLVLELLLRTARPEALALHMHDTRGTALANIVVGLEHGIRNFDASVGGLGGCPYAPGAAGTVATEDLVYMLEGMGIATGVDLERLVEAARAAESIVHRPLPGKVHRAGIRSLRA